MQCKKPFVYGSKNTTSSTLKSHISICKVAVAIEICLVENMLNKNSNAPWDIKPLITDSYAKMCNCNITSKKLYKTP